MKQNAKGRMIGNAKGFSHRGKGPHLDTSPDARTQLEKHIRGVRKAGAKVAQDAIDRSTKNAGISEQY